MDGQPTVSPTLIESNAQPYFSRHLKTLDHQPLLAGRPKGSKAKHTVRIKEAIDQVFSALNGWEGMLAWAKDNPNIFYGQVIPKLLPRIAPTEGDMNVLIQIRQITQQLTEKPLELSPLPSASAAPTD